MNGDGASLVVRVLVFPTLAWPSWARLSSPTFSPGILTVLGWFAKKTTEYTRAKHVQSHEDYTRERTQKRIT